MDVAGKETDKLSGSEYLIPDWTDEAIKSKSLPLVFIVQQL